MPLNWDTKAPVVGDQYVVIGGETGKPFEGCDLYYKRLLQRYARAEKPTCDLTVLNLLKIMEHSEETKLSEYYQESLRHTKKQLAANMVSASMPIVTHETLVSTPMPLFQRHPRLARLEKCLF